MIGNGTYVTLFLQSSIRCVIGDFSSSGNGCITASHSFKNFIRFLCFSLSNAGENQQWASGAIVVLDGSSSYDPEGSDLTFMDYLMIVLTTVGIYSSVVIASMLNFIVCVIAWRMWERYRSGEYD